MNLYQRVCSPLAVALLLAVAGCSRKPVVTVNGLSVSDEEFAQRCANYVPSPERLGGESVGLQVLADVIRVKVVEKELERMNKMPTEAEVNRRFEAEKKQAAFFDQPLDERLRREGRSEPAYKQDLRDRMMLDNYFMRDTSVSDAEAKQYYDGHLDHPQWSLKERVRISVITLASKDRIKPVMEELRSGATFATVAANMSVDDLRSRRGAVPRWFTREDLLDQNLPIPHPLLKKAFELKESLFSEAIQVANDPRDANKGPWVIVRLDQKKPAESMPFQDVKEIVRAAVRMEKMAPRRDENARRFARLMQDAEIEANRPEWQEYIRQFRRMIEQEMSRAGGPGQAEGHEGHAHP